MDSGVREERGITKLLYVCIGWFCYHNKQELQQHFYSCQLETEVGIQSGGTNQSTLTNRVFKNFLSFYPEVVHFAFTPYCL